MCILQATPRARVVECRFSRRIRKSELDNELRSFVRSFSARFVSGVLDHRAFAVFAQTWNLWNAGVAYSDISFFPVCGSFHFSSQFSYALSLCALPQTGTKMKGTTCKEEEISEYAAPVLQRFDVWFSPHDDDDGEGGLIVWWWWPQRFWEEIPRSRLQLITLIWNECAI